MEAKRFIISGGGTGGHIFPAISIANALMERYPTAQILFVGAQGRMEMQRVPEAGYRIEGLPVAGFNRKNPLKNIAVLLRLRRSMSMAKRILRSFDPHAVIGVGGYASGPTLKVASRLGIPILIQEQNSHAGITNKLLAKKASKICVAYSGMEQFFPRQKIVLTGNPVRQGLHTPGGMRREALQHFGLSPEKKTILVLGGSLGARTINESIIAQWDNIAQADDIQWIWQTGKYYFDSITDRLNQMSEAPVALHRFIDRMDMAYAVADLVVSRAGAGSISEFALLGKPVLLVPSPNVAEDHQTKNATALAANGAAVMIPDSQAVARLVAQALEMVRDAQQLETLSVNIIKMAFPDAANRIVEEITKIIEMKEMKE